MENMFTKNAPDIDSMSTMTQMLSAYLRLPKSKYSSIFHPNKHHPTTVIIRRISRLQ
ncbi:hypothetical protein EG68_07315 [Paragonimus skrjabini miyazakii]|uniref:Uncharacterized protein n=1 Tax=Paragonimus skrjabini miyazakii TaxID=59628 RepID=A0A8S9YP83_9TREM|nr:hypothetical protein EG68_07315 [Paragonimus skrjabini miyazakii]